MKILDTDLKFYEFYEYFMKIGTLISLMAEEVGINVEGGFFGKN